MCVYVFTHKKKESENPGLSGQYQISVFTRPASGGSLASNCDPAVGTASTADPPSTLTRQGAVRSRFGHPCSAVGSTVWFIYLNNNSSTDIRPAGREQESPAELGRGKHNTFCLQEHWASNNVGNTLHFLSQPSLCIYQPAYLPLFVLVYLCRHRRRGGWRGERGEENLEISRKNLIKHRSQKLAGYQLGGGFLISLTTCVDCH